MNVDYSQIDSSLLDALTKDHPTMQGSANAAKREWRICNDVCSAQTERVLGDNGHLGHFGAEAANLRPFCFFLRTRQVHTERVTTNSYIGSSPCTLLQCGSRVRFWLDQDLRAGLDINQKRLMSGQAFPFFLPASFLDGRSPAFASLPLFAYHIMIIHEARRYCAEQVWNLRSWPCDCCSMQLFVSHVDVSTGTVQVAE